jgi:hypothetical protein
MPRLLTKVRTPILNDRLVVINTAEANTLLGQMIMILDTGRGEYLQFKTIDNTLRWVDKRHILLQE